MKNKIAVIGLGYVGLPLAVEFGKYFDTVGYDINLERLEQLRNRADITLELEESDFAAASRLIFTNSLEDIEDCNVYIVTVPTPIDQHKKPDLGPLLSASKSIGTVLKKNDLVIYESTVYPGATEDDCVPVLEQTSGLKYNKDFYVGYSPERINPGDKEHCLTNILKVTSGSDPETAEKVDKLYGSIISAGTFKASSIRVAEAAKVIENTQRDLNIALVNEFALIFNELDIDTEEVLEAAGTKWNFLPFRPGLVGGHCIGVDPYYLTHKAQEIGYQPEIILAGRGLNDNMSKNIVNQLDAALKSENIKIKDSRILTMGLTFKENCPDFRNTKVINMITELQEFGATVDCYDPWVKHSQVLTEYNIKLLDTLKKNTYDAIILAVSHQDFIDMGSQVIRSLGKKNHILYDLKYLFPSSETDLRL